MNLPKSLQAIRDYESEAYYADRGPASTYIDGFDACAEILWPELEKMRQALIFCSGLIEDNYMIGAQVKVTDIERLTDILAEFDAKFMKEEK